MNPRIRLTSAKIEVGVEVEAELGNFNALLLAFIGIKISHFPHFGIKIAHFPPGP